MAAELLVLQMLWRDKAVRVVEYGFIDSDAGTDLHSETIFQ
jgi:hypothetical protein